MNLYSEYGAAYSGAIQKFFNIKKLSRVYIYLSKTARQDLFVVLTEKEVANLKLKIAAADAVIGERDNEKAIWQDINNKLNDPETQKRKNIIRFINAEQRARRLGEKIRKTLTVENKEENLDGLQ